MAFKEMSQPEIDHLLDVERVMRVGFEAHGERYLVPLGFVWHQDALYAMTTRGRKTRMAAANPKVSFQMDTSARTGFRICQIGCRPSTQGNRSKATSSTFAFVLRS